MPAVGPILAAMPNAGVLQRRNEPLPDAAGHPGLPGPVRPPGCRPRRRPGRWLLRHRPRAHHAPWPRRSAVAPPPVGAPARWRSRRRGPRSRPRPRPQSSLAAQAGGGALRPPGPARPAQGDQRRPRSLDGAERLAAAGSVDALDVNSNPLARLRMDSLWLAAEIQARCGVETVPHITPRDASLMGLQSQLLGAWQRGDPQPAGHLRRPLPARRLPGRARRLPRQHLRAGARAVADGRGLRLRRQPDRRAAVVPASGSRSTRPRTTRRTRSTGCSARPTPAPTSP